MPPHPHGPGMIGGIHSHDIQYPDDNWNLYSMLDHEATSGKLVMLDNAQICLSAEYHTS
jgi:hypothetical protein